MTFASLPGAVRANDSNVVLHYGSFVSEQRLLEAGAVVARDDLAILKLTGADRLSWLDSLSSQAVGSLAPGAGAETLILDPQGHVEHVLHVVDDGHSTWVIVNADRADAASKWLTKMRFRLDVQIADVSDEWFVLTQVGDVAFDFSARGYVGWRDPWPGVVAGGFGYAAAVANWNQTEWLVPRPEVESVIADLQTHKVAIVGVLAWQALRIAAGRPDASDLDERSLPHEFDWLRTAVHLSKGCYRGQETVAKVHNLGRPPRRLVLLHLDGSDSVLPVAGDSVWASRDGEPREVGQVVAAAHHFELGPTALALIKRAVPVDLALTVRTETLDVAASQQELVPADAGPAVNIPRMPRLGIRT